jgi:argininosuccinate synthase
MKQHRCSDTNFRIEIGVISTKNNDGININENSVEMSEKNFLYLISMLPKCDERTSIMNRIRHIEDKMIELKFKTTAELTTDLLLHTLNEEINQITFEADVMELVKSMPRIVGKINLEKK